MPGIYAPDGSMNVTVVSGSGGGTSGGSVTNPGVGGTQAQAVQGISGGVPVATTFNQRLVKAEGGGTTSSTVNTATQVLGADPTRTKFEFQNTGTATITLRINQGSDTSVANAASTTKRMISVPAGQLYVSEPDVKVDGLISVVSATASVPYFFFAS